jgi:hypothetical protein
MEVFTTIRELPVIYEPSAAYPDSKVESSVVTVSTTIRLTLLKEASSCNVHRGYNEKLCRGIGIFLKGKYFKMLTLVKGHGDNTWPNN